MLKIVLISIFGLAYASAACNKNSITRASGTHAPTKEICSGDLIFEDDFNKLDFTKWRHENTLAGGGNWEFQWYTNNRSNSFAENGYLKIKPTLTANDLGEAALRSAFLDVNGAEPADACTNAQAYGCARTGTPSNILNPVKSAGLRSVHSFSFCYGRVEVRAKQPKGDWLWPAFWLLPRNNAYGMWPASGEIDIFESRGNSQLTINGVNIGVQQVGSTLHWGPDYPNNQYSRTQKTKNDPKGFNSDFHIYEMIWTNNSITFRVDRVDLFTVTPPAGGFWELGGFQSTKYLNPWKSGSKMAPFDEEFYFILNLAVGGVNGYFPDIATNPTRKPWSNTSPTAAANFWDGKNSWLPSWNLNSDDSTLQVDYIRVYAL